MAVNVVNLMKAATGLRAVANTLPRWKGNAIGGKCNASAS
jgi:hypothetical protein